jgi:hypothetical protein
MEPKRMMVIGTKIYLMHQGSGKEGVDVGTYMDAKSKVSMVKLLQLI